MAKKSYFCIIDTETTQTDMVADLGIVVCDRKGNIEREYGLLVGDFYLDRTNHPLFHIGGFLGGEHNLPARYAKYDRMVSDGTRMLASVAAINRLFAKIEAQYSPTYTAYNMAFDYGKMRNTGLAVELMANNFCLWHAAAHKWGRTKAYRQFILDDHLFKARTSHGNMSYPTNAEVMTRFIKGDHSIADEPHTALEDARDYELPILARLLAVSKSREAYVNAPAYSWRDYQVKDAYTPV